MHTLQKVKKPEHFSHRFQYWQTFKNVLCCLGLRLAASSAPFFQKKCLDLNGKASYITAKEGTLTFSFPEMCTRVAAEKNSMAFYAMFRKMRRMMERTCINHCTCLFLNLKGHQEFYLSVSN